MGSIDDWAGLKAHTARPSTRPLHYGERRRRTATAVGRILRIRPLRTATANGDGGGERSQPRGRSRAPRARAATSAGLHRIPKHELVSDIVVPSS